MLICLFNGGDGVGFVNEVTSVHPLLKWSQSEVTCLFPPQKHGLVIIPDGTPNGDVNHEPQPSGITVVSQEAAQLLESAGEGPLGESGVIAVPQNRTCTEQKIYSA